MSYRQSKSIQLGLVGLVLGGLAGFVIRDEYYFPSYQRVDELIQEYNQGEAAIDKEIQELQDRLKVLATKPKAPEPQKGKEKEKEKQAKK